MWTKVRLGDIVCTNSSSYTNSLHWNYVNYLDTGNITENVVDFIQHIDLTSQKLPSRARRLVKYNSIIYSTVRPNQRHYGIIKEQENNFLVSTAFTVIDVNPAVADADFIYYYLTQDWVTNTLQTLAEQNVSTYPSINSSHIENLIVSLPPIDIQRKIASVLYSLDSKIRLKRAINQNLEQQARILFNASLVSLDNLPSGWRQSNLLEIADFLNGLAMQNYRPIDYDFGIPVIKIRELRQGYCDETSDRCSTRIPSQYVVHNGDVIFSWSGTLFADIWCGDTCGLNQHLFKVTSSTYDKWFYLSWTKHYLKKFCKIAADKATTMGHIKRSDLEDSVVLIPSKDDYVRIGRLIAPLYSMIEKTRLQTFNLVAIRDQLLQKLMSGMIDISP